MKHAKLPITYIQAAPEKWTSHEGEIIVEAPVSLTVNGEVWLTFMCTPIDLEAMAVGFLYNEGVVSSIEEVASVFLCASGDNVDIWLHHSVEKPDKWRRTSGCTGGFTAVEEGAVIYPPVNGTVLPASHVTGLIAQLFEAQQLYRESGGVHTSGLSDGERIVVVAEDIGRHNTLDKLAGRYLLEGLQLKRKVILTTGRISSEMLQKSARLGAGILVSRTSPSSLSIETAERMGITLIGYARRNRFNIYTHPERIFPSDFLDSNIVQEPDAAALAREIIHN
jgi:FdhD protein